MKKIKSVLSLLLCFALILSLLVPAFAAELTADGTSASTVAHSVNAEFTASIPAYVMPGEPGEASAGYTVTLENAVIPDSHELTAKVEYSGAMTEQNGVELPYELLDESGVLIASGSKILTKAAGTPDESVSVSFGAALTAKARYAGVYTDTATFAFDVAEKVYTIDEIDADEHLFAIGKTKPEYVVAQFNDDFSAVTIFQNGENSDGWMKDWIKDSYSPMYRKGETLQTAIVKDGVKNIGIRAFGNEYGRIYTPPLNEVSLPDSIISIGDYAFGRNASIEYITLPANLETIGKRSFEGTGVKDVTIPNSVMEIGEGAFSNCNKLEKVILSENITKILRNSFCWCSKLKEIYIPDSVVEINKQAFFDCSTLTSITGMKNVKIIDNAAFCNTHSLSHLELFEGLEYIGDCAFGAVSDYYSYSNGEPDNYNHGSRSSRSESSGDLHIPSTVTHIGKSAFPGAFSDITVAEDNPYFCVQDGILYTSDFKRIIATTQSLKDTIEEYIALSTLEIIDDFAFFSCLNLKSIDFSYSNVRVIGDDAFYNCKTLETLICPEIMDSIGYEAFSDPMGYYSCQFQNVVFPKEIKKLGGFSFAYQDIKLVETDIPKGLTVIPTMIFWNNNAITRVIIPEGVEEIYGSAFGGCNNLVSATIPASVTFIHKDAFRSCDKLTTIYGVSDSYAETWAAENGYTFVAQ